MVDSIMNWLKQYKNTEIEIDYMGEDALRYSLKLPINTPIISKDINGNKYMQKLFSFSAKRLFGDNTTNEDNLRLFEDFREWVENQNELDNLPILAENQQATEVEVLTDGYLLQADDDLQNATYVIQCRLLYNEEKATGRVVSL